MANFSDHLEFRKFKSENKELNNLFKYIQSLNRFASTFYTVQLLETVYTVENKSRFMTDKKKREEIITKFATEMLNLLQRDKFKTEIDADNDQYQIIQTDLSTQKSKNLNVDVGYLVRHTLKTIEQEHQSGKIGVDLVWRMKNSKYDPNSLDENANNESHEFPLLENHIQGSDAFQKTMKLGLFNVHRGAHSVHSSEFHTKKMFVILSDLSHKFSCSRPYIKEKNIDSLCKDLKAIFALTKIIKNKARASLVVSELTDMNVEIHTSKGQKNTQAIDTAAEKIKKCRESLELIQIDEHSTEAAQQPATRAAPKTWNPFSSAYTRFNDFRKRRGLWGGTRKRRRTAFKARRIKR
jgi:hypothetical protein